MITMTQELEELIDGTISVPTIPTILTEITSIVDSADGSAKDAGAIIEKDPAIAARVLRLVNSPFYGLRNPVSSIHLACSILGLKVIRNLVVQATVLQSFGDAPETSAFNVGWLWDHSFKTAVACKLLARHWPSSGLQPDDAYTCGLIHDIGKMILLESQTERFAEALRRSAEGAMPLAAAEGEVFGFDHAHVGGLLAQRWKLAEAVQIAVTEHHNAAAPSGDQAYGFLVKAANTLAHRAAADSRSGGKSSYRGDLVDDDALLALGIDERDMADIMEQVRTTGAL